MQHEPAATILVLGHGNSGRAIARNILAFTSCNIIVGGPDGSRAAKCARALSQTHPEHRISSRAVDGNDPQSLIRALSGADLLIVAAGIPDRLRDIALSCIEAGVDYLDLWYSPRKRQQFVCLAVRAELAGRLIITECGLQPGLPAVLVRDLARSFEAPETALVASYIRADWEKLIFSSSTRTELREPFASWIMRDSKWQSSPPGVNEAINVDFGMEHGVRTCRAIFYGELADVSAQLPSLRNLAFVVDHSFGQRCEPPYFARLQANISGCRHGNRVRSCLSVQHTDGFELTAISVVVSIKEWLRARKFLAGLVSNGAWVETGSALTALASMGAAVEREEMQA